MRPYFTGKYKKRYDILIAGGMDSCQASAEVYAQMDRDSSLRTIRQLEADNKALRLTIKQLCLYGTK